MLLIVIQLVLQTAYNSDSKVSKILEGQNNINILHKQKNYKYNQPITFSYYRCTS